MKLLRILSLCSMAVLFSGGVATAAAVVTGHSIEDVLPITLLGEVGLGVVSALAFAGGVPIGLGARVQNPIIGQAINQAGGMVFSNWKQLRVMRSKPLSVANPKTQGQQAQRNRMALFASLFREILQTVRTGFVRYQNGTTQWAQFVKENLMSATTVTGTVASLDASALSFSKGTLLPVIDFTIDTITGQDIDLTWDDNSGQPGASATDALRIVLVNVNGSAVAALSPAATRSDAGVTITAPVDLTAATCKVYAFFVNAAGDDVSDSQVAY